MGGELQALRQNDVTTIHKQLASIQKQLASIHKQTDELASIQTQLKQIHNMMGGSPVRQSRTTETDIWKPKKLLDMWVNYNESHYLDHWLEYADHYQYHLEKLAAERTPPISPRHKVKLLEFGVQSGGSARLWKQYYGESLYYVGFDIDPRCKRTESPAENMFVEIGSQLDTHKILAACHKHGPFDVVIDDGGHTTAMMQTALDTIFLNDKCMKQDSLMVIEDMHDDVEAMDTNNACHAQPCFRDFPQNASLLEGTTQQYICDHPC